MSKLADELALIGLADTINELMGKISSLESRVTELEAQRKVDSDE